MKTQYNEHEILIDELVHLLNGGNAHADLTRALDGLPSNLRGVKPDKLPYSIWQLVEHIRIAQWDMLEFCKDGSHESPNWPDDYWPKETSPTSDEAWNKSVRQINKDTDELMGLAKTGNLFEKIPHGDGQTILREILQAADHNAYHLAEIIMVRRLLDAWNN
ncbi:DinB family protein [Mucilaginibacter sabulilitoris]|uniref:DinB family protein n=1 Tax=Mucilaginibacter sabulilitoris TaxID=1173583 RepID=A0ABZ0TSM9_9SPHI|nr:DinB family protein [Mucilaginibacter sabulilitoris]WPU95467.1 DinB family protein [Mucilaginibacter sabulilitoris]